MGFVESMFFKSGWGFFVGFFVGVFFVCFGFFFLRNFKEKFFQLQPKEQVNLIQVLKEHASWRAPNPT